MTSSLIKPLKFPGFSFDAARKPQKFPEEGMPKEGEYMGACFTSHMDRTRPMVMEGGFYHEMYYFKAKDPGGSRLFDAVAAAMFVNQ